MTRAIDAALFPVTPTRPRSALADIARARRDLVESGEAGAIPAFDAPTRPPPTNAATPTTPPREPARQPEHGREERTYVRGGGARPDGAQGEPRTAADGPPASSSGDGARANGAARDTQVIDGGEQTAARPVSTPGLAPAAMSATPADAGAMLARLGSIGASGAIAARAGVTGGASGAPSGTAAGSATGSPGVARTVARGAPATYQRAQTQPATRAERDALIEQIQRGLAQALRRGEGDLTIRLRPEHLGHVRVRVSVVAEQVTAAIGASSERARDLLGSELKTLRDALEARGLSVDRIVVEHDEQASAEREAPRERDAGEGAASQWGRRPDDHTPGAERGGEALPTIRAEPRSWDGRIDTLA